MSSPAKAPSDVDACNVMLDGGPRSSSSVYTHWLLNDGVIKRVSQLDVLLREYQRVTEADLMDGLVEMLGRSGELWARAGKMQRLNRELTEVALGYQALDARCARITDDLAADAAFVQNMMIRTDATLVDIQHFLDQRPGRDTDWVRDHVRRAYQAMDAFRVRCVENPPPQKTGRFRALKNLLFP